MANEVNQTVRPTPRITLKRTPRHAELLVQDGLEFFEENVLVTVFECPESIT